MHRMWVDNSGDGNLSLTQHTGAFPCHSSSLTSSFQWLQHSHFTNSTNRICALRSRKVDLTSHINTVLTSRWLNTIKALCYLVVIRIACIACSCQQSDLLNLLCVGQRYILRTFITVMGSARQWAHNTKSSVSSTVFSMEDSKLSERFSIIYSINHYLIDSKSPL